MSYLENKYCTFKPLFKFDPIEKKDIIIILLFKLDTSYKNFSKYTDNLVKIKKYSKEKFPSFTIRLFIDEAVENDPKLKWLQNEFETVVFKCAPFWNEKTNNHIGLFSTVARFFIFHTFPNNDAKDIIMMDADIRWHEVDYLIEGYGKTKNIQDLYFYYVGGNKMSYGLSNPHIFPNVMASRMIFYKKLDKKVFEEFLDYSLTGKLEMKNYYGKDSETRGEGSFRYGYDELYLNRYLLPHCIKQNQLCAYFKYYEVKHMLEYVFKSDKKHTENSAQLLEFVLGVYYSPSLPLQNNINKLYEIFEKKHHLERIQEYVTKRMYYMLKLMRKFKQYKLYSEHQLDIFIDIYDGIVSISGVGFTDLSIPDIESSDVTTIRYKEPMLI